MAEFFELGSTNDKLAHDLSATHGNERKKEGANFLLFFSHPLTLGAGPNFWGRPRFCLKNTYEPELKKDQDKVKIDNS